MKPRSIAALLVLVMALGAGCLTYVCMREPTPSAPAGEDAALLWLRYEFKLGPAQMDRIASMHTAYRLICDEHCRLVREARTKLAGLRTTRASAREMADAEQALAGLDQLCVTSLEAHLRAIAAVIGGDEGLRYLSIVLPRVSRFDHGGAPDLNLGESCKQHDAHAHD